MPVRNCYVLGCSSRRGPGISFIKFPTNDPDRCRQWCSALKIVVTDIDDLKNQIICHHHFELKHLNIHYTARETAVPIEVQSNSSNVTIPLKVVNNPVLLNQIRQQDSSLKRKSEVIDKQETRLESKQAKIKSMTQSLSRLKNAVEKQKITNLTQELLAEHFKDSATVTQIIILQFERFGKRQNSHYNTLEKSLALTLYYCTGKNGYRSLQKLGFRIPHLSTIRRWLHHLKFLPGHNREALECLKDKVSKMNDKEKDCSLMLDEMSVKKFIEYNRFTDSFFGFEKQGDKPTVTVAADHALVFMLRGINTNYKMAVSYHFSRSTTRADDLKELLSNTLTNLKETGVRVRSVVCDQGGCNRGMYNRLGVTIDKPFILHQDQKIYCFYDMPHLMKSIRNNLYGSDGSDGEDLLVPARTGPGNEIVSYKHIKSLYSVDLSLVQRTCPKLNDANQVLTNSSKMKVKYFCHTFSRTLYSALKTMVEKGLLPPSHLPTAYFAQKLDNIFDLLNVGAEEDSNYYKAGKNIFKNIDLLKSYAKWISQVTKSSGRQGKIPCLDGLELTLNAIVMLLTDLKAEGYGFVLTRRLQSDGLENFFSMIKLRTGSSATPTCQQFRYAFRYMFVSNIMMVPEGSNCEQFEDDETLNSNMSKLDYLLNKQNFLDEPVVQNDAMNYTDNEFESSASEDDNDEDRTSYNANPFFRFIEDLESNETAENASIFLAGRVIKKVIQQRKCVDCKKLLEFINDRECPALDSLETLHQFKAYGLGTFTNSAELGFGHLLTDSTKSVFKRVCNIFARTCKNAFNEVGTHIVKNVVRGLKSDSTISNFVRNCEDLGCLKHREEMLERFVRTRMYSLAQQKNDLLNGRATFVPDMEDLDSLEPQL